MRSEIQMELGIERLLFCLAVEVATLNWYETPEKLLFRKLLIPE